MATPVRALLIGLTVVLAMTGCSRSFEGELTVRVTADNPTDAGCRGLVPVGSTTRLTALVDGQRHATGSKFNLHPDAGSCDWIATITLPKGNVITLEGEGEPFVSIDAGDVRRGEVHIHANLSGVHINP